MLLQQPPPDKTPPQPQVMRYQFVCFYFKFVHVIAYAVTPERAPNCKHQHYHQNTWHKISRTRPHQKRHLIANTNNTTKIPRTWHKISCTRPTRFVLSLRMTLKRDIPVFLKVYCTFHLNNNQFIDCRQNKIQVCCIGVSFRGNCQSYCTCGCTACPCNCERFLSSYV